MWFVACIFVVALWYFVQGVQLLKTKGLDPTLLTHITPLRYWHYFGTRIIIGLVSVAAYYTPLFAAQLTNLSIILVVTHVVLLVAFNRQRTQPTLYYILTIPVCLCIASSYVWLSICGVALWVLQECYLKLWKQQEHAHYNTWVKKKALNIHEEYHPHFMASVSLEVWYTVLHIITTEALARPYVSRLIEKIYFYTKKPAVITTGIMQVASSRILSDAESIDKGIAIVRVILAELPANLSPQERLQHIAHGYNGSYGYAKYLEATQKGTMQAIDEIASGA